MTKINYAKTGDKLKGKIILITGAGDGIGKAVSKACANHKATVILTGRTQKKLNQTYDEIVVDTGTEPLICLLNLVELDDTAAQEMACSIYNEFGRLDGLLHNVATLGTMSPYAQFDSKLWRQVFQVNVHAPFILTKACLPLLRLSKNPSIIFTGSGLGKYGMAYWGAYCASKFANEGMMQTLAEELESDNIKVNMIDPGVVRTKLRASAFPAENPKSLPEASQITDAYIYLLSDDSIGTHKQRVDAWVRNN